MIWHKSGEVAVPGGESERISVQKNTWQGAFHDICLCLVVRKNQREKGKNRDQTQITWNQFSLSGT